MARRLISGGSAFETEIGYSRAVVQGPWIFVSGTTGYNYAERTISPNIVEQAEQTLVNIEAALKEAGATMADVVRVHYIVVDKKEFPACFPVMKKYFGESRPAATMIQAGLFDDDMKIEIEVTAMLQGSSLS